MKNISLKQWSSILTTFLTSAATFYLALSKIWELPYGDKVTDTVFALVAFISAGLGAFTIKKVYDANQNGVPDDEEEKEVK